MTTGENIKRIRKEKKLTQKQLGGLCEPKISESTIRKYELNILNPKIETTKKIANALKVSIRDLMPDVYEQGRQESYELHATDYSFIEVIASHKIFTDKERKKIFDKIEHGNYCNKPHCLGRTESKPIG